ncbi:MAG: hypothetical protein ACYSUK_09495 [Planctomycetota bacterium]|jgi:outer membrane protein assembly factor BamE (lipoprotein component of BamABCDE complex)
MRGLICLLVLVVFLAGCDAHYARRDEIKVGMSREEVSNLVGGEYGSVGEYIYRTERGKAYRVYLKESYNTIRAYKFVFSDEGTLVQIMRDQPFEDTVLDNSAGFIRSQNEMTDAEPVYWQK